MKPQPSTSIKRVLSPVQKREGDHVTCQDHDMIEFTSNDYLGLSMMYEDPSTAIQRLGYGSTGSRLLSGDHDLFHELESELADWKKKPSALLFNSGYQANVGVLSVLATAKSLVLADKWVHASILDGIQLSGAKLVRFKHNDVGHLKTLLTKYVSAFSHIVVVTESVFSMDGDCAPLNDIVALKSSFVFTLIVDEAHATGIFGEYGEGLVSELGLTSQVDVIVGTFGKSFGSFGAYVVADAAIKEALINHARSFMFSTALPTGVVVQNLSRLRWIKANPGVGQEVLEKAEDLRQAMKVLSLQVVGESQIVPWIIGDVTQTERVAQWMGEQGIRVLPIRPPTVPAHSARLRFSVTRWHSVASMETLKKALQDYVAMGKL